MPPSMRPPCGSWLFMILTAVFLLGEKVRWRRGLATIAGFIGVLVIVRPDSGALDEAAMIGLLGAFWWRFQPRF